MKKNKPNTNYQPYEIDSGYINSELKFAKDEYPIEILKVFRGSLMTLLIQKAIVTIPYSEENVPIIEDLGKENPPDLWSLNYFKFQYHDNTNEALNNKPYITHFNESCVISKNEDIFDFQSFDLYFALRLNLTDLMHTFSFLDFQLNRNFDDNFLKFKIYLEQLVRKYKGVFLKEGVIESVVSWIEQYPQNVIEMSEDFEKIEWLGNQKQLAELFIELHQKGWIGEIPTKLIKQYFTKSDSIHQILKPSQDPKTKEKKYEGTYTKSYKPRFDAIRQNIDK